MTTVAELRTQLASKGFALTSPTTEQQAGLPTLSLHLHPLSTKPIILVGGDSEGAREYQVQAVSDAIKRK